MSLVDMQNTRGFLTCHAITNAHHAGNFNNIKFSNCRYSKYKWALKYLAISKLNAQADVSQVIWFVLSCSIEYHFLLFTKFVSFLDNLKLNKDRYISKQVYIDLYMAILNLN